MTSAEFRNALAKLRFLELPEFIDLTLYHSDIASIWRNNPVRGFLQLSDDDQDKVFAAICDDDAGRESQTSEMVERVAKAVRRRQFERTGLRKSFDMQLLQPTENELDNARAAIEALREPTKAMLDEGDRHIIVGDVADAWRAMIDSALL